MLSFIPVGPYPQVAGNQLAFVDDEEKRTIQNLVDTMIEGWNTGNADLYTSVFKYRSDYIAFNGERFITRDENRKHHQKLFDTFLKGSKLYGQKIIDLNFISPDVVIVILTGSVKTRWVKQPPRSRASIQSMVAKKTEGEWKFVCFQNTRISRFSVLDGIKMFFQ